MPDRPLRAPEVKGMVFQILEIWSPIQSIGWLSRPNGKIHSSRGSSSNCMRDRPPIYYGDNGAGIAPENRENVFKPFVSLVKKAKRRGLGLFIVREAAQHHGGTLYLEDVADPDTGRLHRSVLELRESVVA